MRKNVTWVPPEKEERFQFHEIPSGSLFIFVPRDTSVIDTKDAPIYIKVRRDREQNNPCVAAVVINGPDAGKISSILPIGTRYHQEVLLLDWDMVVRISPVQKK